MFEFLASLSWIGWLLIIGFIACLAFLPRLLKDMFVPSREPRKHVPGEDPPIYYGPNGGDGGH